MWLVATVLGNIVLAVVIDSLKKKKRQVWNQQVKRKSLTKLRAQVDWNTHLVFLRKSGAQADEVPPSICAIPPLWVHNKKEIISKCPLLMFELTLTQQTEGKYGRWENALTPPAGKY